MECWKIDFLQMKVTHLGIYDKKTKDCAAVVAEWLRRWTRNPLGSARTGSNPVDCEKIFSHKCASYCIIVTEMPYVL